MPEERNQNQIIRIDARNCFVESLNDSFGFGKAHFTFASYDLSKPSGQRQTNSIQMFSPADLPLIKLYGQSISGKPFCQELFRFLGSMFQRRAQQVRSKRDLASSFLALKS